MSHLPATLDAAKHFGLTGDEVWETFERWLDEVGSDASLSDCFDELSAALAARILLKQRRSAARPSRTADTGRAR
jgi:hypothetical protein